MNFGVHGRVPANFQSTAPCRARPSLDFSGDGRKLAISTLVVIGEESPICPHFSSDDRETANISPKINMPCLIASRAATTFS